MDDGRLAWSDRSCSLSRSTLGSGRLVAEWYLVLGVMGECTPAGNVLLVAV
jgi:hypothetical protein